MSEKIMAFSKEELVARVQKKCNCKVSLDEKEEYIVYGDGFNVSADMIFTGKGKKRRLSKADLCYWIYFEIQE